MSILRSIVAAAGLAACGGEPDSPTIPLPGGNGVGASSVVVRPDAPVPTVPLVEPITAYGRDPMRVGMEEREALAALGLPEPPEGEASESCRSVDPPDGPANYAVMIEDGRVARVSVTGPSAVRTREGLGVGSTAAQVRTIYGDALREEPHEYVPGGRYLTWWASEGTAGVRFETDAEGRVTAVHGGGPAIGYSEGCA